MKKRNALERIFFKRKDFIEIIDSNSEESLQFILNIGKENQVKFKSISPFYESQSEVRDICTSRGNIFDSEGQINVTNYFEKTSILYSAYEKINFQDYLNKEVERKMREIIEEREIRENLEKKEKFLFQAKENWSAELYNNES